MTTPAILPTRNPDYGFFATLTTCPERDRRSVEVNDFAGFLAAHPQLRRLCFNGATAQAMFRRHVLPTLAAPLAFDMVRLPSTSPAHAGMRPADKRRAWQAAVLDGPGHPAQDGPA